MLHVKDPAPSDLSAPAAQDAAAFPHEQTFKLHSKPGAQRSLYLDFNGQVVSGTAWNTGHGLPLMRSQPVLLDRSALRPHPGRPLRRHDSHLGPPINTDTYSDGAASPFGTASTDATRLSMYASSN